MTNLPPWVAPVVAAVRDNPNWLLDTVEAIANAPGNEASQARLLGLRAVLARIPVPMVASDSAFYAEQVLALLGGPEMALSTPEEVLGLAQAVASVARGRCGVLAATLTALAADNSEVTL